jgi:hypothetical protein
MKKWFVLALGVLLMAAFTAPVLAETKVEFKGHYRVRYQYVHNTGTLEDSGDRTDQQNWFDQRFRIEPTFIVSDNLRLVVRIEGLDGLTWGSHAGGGDRLGDNGQGWNFERAFMQINTRFGQFRVGRMAAGTSGLYAMGYAGGMFASNTGLNESAMFDSGYDANRIFWSLPIGNFNIAAVYEKQFDNDRNNTGNQTSNVAVGPFVYSDTPGYDDDQDFFALVPSFKWSTGQANLTMVYTRGRASGSEFIGAIPAAMLPPRDFDMYLLQPAVRLMFGPFNWNFEFQYRWQNWETNKGWITANQAAITAAGLDVRDRSNTGWGLYTDFSWTYGPGQVGMMFSYTDGPDYNTTGPDQTGILTTGSWHAPFLVAYNYGTGSYLYTQGTPNVSNQSNHWLLGLWADHNLTENLMLHAALGYMQMNEAPNDVWNAAGTTKLLDYDSKAYGVEFDLGLSLKLMDGLNYYTLFGYFWPGDYNQFGVMNNNDLGPAYGWLNQLTLSF